MEIKLAQASIEVGQLIIGFQADGLVVFFDGRFVFAFVEKSVPLLKKSSALWACTSRRLSKRKA
ncbi:MAG: hypothetical protein HC912_06770 [Saprospiraceae bacterium]|nr:hypothetical protein [Saprospiraceae bacterium]